jgi:host factor-I protein
MDTSGSDIQAQFLSGLVAERKTVWIFLVTGIRLVGTIASFDRYVIALHSQGSNQVV